MRSIGKRRRVLKLIRNIEKNAILELKNEIQVKEGSVVSQNLARNSGFELSLYSFGGKESISEQVSFGEKAVCRCYICR